MEPPTFFATRGEDADAERARWVADVARGIRVLTQSLFPPFTMCTLPLMGAKWTATRLLAGYMILCHHSDVFLAYCELHAQKDLDAAFVAYKDDYCDARIVHCSISVNTSISERVGVDCSCFSIDGHHFTTRSNAEKNLWLRAISNVKTKMRHNAGNPSDIELCQYRAAIAESIEEVASPSDCVTRCALLPCRIPRRETQHAVEKTRSRVDTDVGEDTDAADQSSSVHADQISRVMVVPSRSARDPPYRNSGDQHDDSCGTVSLGPAEDVGDIHISQTSQPQPHKQRLERSSSLLSTQLAGPTYKPPQLPEFVEKDDVLSESTTSRSQVDSRENTETGCPDPKLLPLATPAVISKSTGEAHEDFPTVANEHLPAICFM